MHQTPLTQRILNPIGLQYRQEMKALLLVIKNCPDEAIRRAKLHVRFVDLQGLKKYLRLYYTEKWAKSIRGSVWEKTGASHRPDWRVQRGLVWYLARLMDWICLAIIYEHDGTKAKHTVYLSGNQLRSIYRLVFLRLLPTTGWMRVNPNWGFCPSPYW